MIALGDPNLPIHLVGSESEMVTFDPADYSASKILYIHNRGHELFVRIRHQQIRGRYWPVVLVPQRVDELVDGPGSSILANWLLSLRSSVMVFPSKSIRHPQIRLCASRGACPVD